MMQRWIYKPTPSEDVIDSISSSLGFGYLASKILVMRGVDSYQKAREFFKPKDRLSLVIRDPKFYKWYSVPGKVYNQHHSR